MLNRLSLVSIVAVLGLWNVAQPSQAQALTPHILQIETQRLEELGSALAQEALQLAQLQQYDLAVPRAALAAQLAPQSAEVWSLLGGLYLQTDAVPQGIEALKRAQALDPKNTAVLFALGSAYFQQAKYPAAVEYLTAGLKLKPNVPGALFDLGNAYLMLRQYPDAVAQYEKAIAQDKTFWPAINNIGLVEYEKGNLDAALRSWRKAADLDQKSAEPRLAIAIALYKQGNREQGWTFGESAVALDSRYTDLKFLKENLWGDRLLTDAKVFLETPRMKASIAQIQGQSPASSVLPE